MGQIRTVYLLCTRITLETAAIRVTSSNRRSVIDTPNPPRHRITVQATALRVTSRGPVAGVPSRRPITLGTVLLVKLPLYESCLASLAKDQCFFQWSRCVLPNVYEVQGRFLKIIFKNHVLFSPEL